MYLIRVFITVFLMTHTANSFASTKVGVVSILGDNVTLRYVGATIFNNEVTDVPMADWKIDDKVVSFIMETLSKQDNIQLVALVNHGLTNTIITQDYEFISGEVLTKASIYKLMELGKNNSLDQILIITPNTVWPHILGKDVDIKGYGVYYNFVYIFTYIASHAYLLDVETGKTLGNKDLWSVSP